MNRIISKPISHRHPTKLRRTGFDPANHCYEQTFFCSEKILTHFVHSILPKNQKFSVRSARRFLDLDRSSIPAKFSHFMDTIGISIPFVRHIHVIGLILWCGCNWHFPRHLSKSKFDMSRCLPIYSNIADVAITLCDDVLGELGNHFIGETPSSRICKCAIIRIKRIFSQFRQNVRIPISVAF